MDNFIFPSLTGSGISGLTIFLGCFFFQEEDYIGWSSSLTFGLIDYFYIGFSLSI
jgi:hypothetical protein